MFNNKTATTAATVTARQVPPELQESPLYMDHYFFDAITASGCTITGNSDYNSHEAENYTAIVARYDEAAEELENLHTARARYGSLSEIVADYFPASDFKRNGKPYSPRDLHAIRAALELYGTDDYYRGRYILAMLTATSGTEYRRAELRGSCHGDWQHFYYPAADEWTAETLKRLETEYFNTGAEWAVHPDTDEEYYIYTAASEDAARAEIAAAEGVEPHAVTLEIFDSYTRTPHYTTA